MTDALISAPPACRPHRVQTSMVRGSRVPSSEVIPPPLGAAHWWTTWTPHFGSECSYLIAPAPIPCTMWRCAIR
jgi:hypothetical protein